jgi:hypothetical protein
VLVVGDVVFIFVLAAQPEIPLGLRMWPEHVVCLNQSQLGLEGAKPEVAKSGSEAAFILQAVTQGLGAQALLSDYGGTMERLAAAMHLGVQNVRRSRQQAKLSHAQRMCHEKKLSLLKTQHMIELLYKSQETFFEAGGDQFENCNAVCMHSGVMRQSLIDVTPFMPVSDFICEYCSQVYHSYTCYGYTYYGYIYLLWLYLLWLPYTYCGHTYCDSICEYCSQVIVLEEQAEATEDAADARDLEHEMQLRREVAKQRALTNRSPSPNPNGIPVTVPLTLALTPTPNQVARDHEFYL